MTYKFQQNIDSNKIFIVKHSEIEGRLEAEYYKPSIAILENKIRKQSPKKLSDYAITMAGGATPKTDNEDYYSNENNGIIFLRVQNLQPTGEITKENCKYITKKIHNGFLKRSQVVGGDLLIKITGVGRMAVACVAPEGFIGNINQHMVVVKTHSKTISHYLARYLNLDIIEKIASRHTTGGTRPALDYSALRSIPIIEGLNFDIIDRAIEVAQQKNKDAQNLLNSIDDYLLKELGITLPKRNEVSTKSIQTWMNAENPLVKNGRLFVTSFKKVEGGRLDPVNILYLGKRTKSANYNNVVLKDITHIEKGQSITSDKINLGIYPVIGGGKSSPYLHNKYNYEGNVITISASGAYAGYTWFHDYPIFASDCNVIRSKNENKYLTKYIFEVLKVQQEQIYILQQGAGQPHVYAADLSKLLIPSVSINMQNEICKYIDKLRNEAECLKNEANNILQKAKSQVEQVIISK